MKVTLSLLNFSSVICKIDKKNHTETSEYGNGVRWAGRREREGGRKGGREGGREGNIRARNRVNDEYSKYSSSLSSPIRRSRDTDKTTGQRAHDTPRHTYHALSSTYKYHTLQTNLPCCRVCERPTAIVL